MLVHDCVLRLQPDVVIVDSESPSRDTLEHLATRVGQQPAPGGGVQRGRQRTRRCSRRCRPASAPTSSRACSRSGCCRCCRWRSPASSRTSALRGQLEQAQSAAVRAQAVERAKGILMARGRPDAKSRPTSTCASWRWTAASAWSQVAERIIEARELLRPRGLTHAARCTAAHQWRAAASPVVRCSTSADRLVTGAERPGTPRA